MAEEKTFRYGFIILGLFLVMTGMFIMSVEKPQIYITFCTLGVLLVAVGITWSMCQCYPKITFIPVDLEAERFLEHKPIVLLEKDTSSLLTPCTKQEASSTYEKSLPSYEQVQRQGVGSALLPTAQHRAHVCSQPTLQARAEVHQELGGSGDPPKELAPRLEAASSSCPSCPALGTAPLASLLEDMDTPSLEGSVPSSPVPRGRTPPSTRSGCTPAAGQRPHKGAAEEDDLYYGLQEGLDALLKDNDCLFEPEN